MTRRDPEPDFRSGPAREVGRLIRNRSREVTLFDSAAGGAAPEAGGRRSRADRRGGRSLAAATGGPALVAAILGMLLAPTFGSDDRGGIGPDSAAAGDLAREAALPLGQGELRPLLPVVERDGRPQLAAHDAPATTPALRPAPPAWISIPAAGVESAVDGLGASAKGLAVPELGRVGWWHGGPRPGEDGRAVIAGHLDSQHGPDVFARVPDLSKGDPIVVRDRAGRAHRYAVVGVTRVRKADFPTDDVYGAAKRPVLVLVTCGGPYDPSIGHYRDNVLVYARAV
jgi:LPXTG-site transpeptidase (sortase) family protein